MSNPHHAHPCHVNILHPSADHRAACHITNTTLSKLLPYFLAGKYQTQKSSLKHQAYVESIRYYSRLLQWRAGDHKIANHFTSVSHKSVVRNRLHTTPPPPPPPLRQLGC
ncbi:hypothetical protein E2C01_038214 [Portunus trituberculatus]|uniref:Uncharacterized protein n=1 Tax=Portunus trituberculatus TaxID=210409 RepID=A0A5B7FA99_PORTR|nr:hypothetical protein [Portunus trituberculatus]